MKSKGPDDTSHMHRMILIWAFCACSKALFAGRGPYVSFIDMKEPVYKTVHDSIVLDKIWLMKFSCSWVSSLLSNDCCSFL